jgi:hypothetical protein
MLEDCWPVINMGYRAIKLIVAFRQGQAWMVAAVKVERQSHPNLPLGSISAL